MENYQKSNLFKDFNGLILIKKPAGISSFDVIRILKNNFFLTK